MIPLKLTISGFLSYRDPVELDFTDIELACISGANGAGKSSLLDAITWALFGRARKNDDSLLNAQCNAAEVALTFAYESSVYRVQRTRPRGKTTQLEFQIQTAAGGWKTINEHSLRENQAAIGRTLRLDYDTFVNASFFLQGKADEFTQRNATERKRILGSILGLEVWEVYRERAGERRKAVDAQLSRLDGEMDGIRRELNEEPARRERVERLEADLERARLSRQAQEQALESMRATAAALEQQARLVETLDRQVQAGSRRLEELRQRLDQRRKDRRAYRQALERADEVRQAFRLWQQARTDLEYWDGLAAEAHSLDQRRQPHLAALNAAQARLEQERDGLLSRQAAAAGQASQAEGLLAQLEAAQAQAAALEARLAGRAGLETGLETARQQSAEAKAAAASLRPQIDQLKERKERLEHAEGAACPVCGQPLAAEDRLRLLEEINAEGKTAAERYRQAQADQRSAEDDARQLERSLAELTQAQAQLAQQQSAAARLAAQREAALQAVAAWESGDAPRLHELYARLENADFALEARQALAGLQAELDRLGYDAARHADARQREQAGRAADADLRTLDKAQAALEPLDREIAGLEEELSRDAAEMAARQTEYDQSAALLAAGRAQLPSLKAAEGELKRLQEFENALRRDAGFAENALRVLDDLRLRLDGLTAERERLARRVSQFKQLEAAFGKDGVPAMLIEQALPEIEAKANDILDRLSGGAMSVRFLTQRPFKDKRRDDLNNTLDILISDSSGTRDYELFSGGEAFRVNFAIRLALSEVLAQRAGARLQTLVIDEGFGSQDVQGRQRLVEAINQVRKDFARILVITHIDELKDAFPARIEVEKTPAGSTLRVLT